MLKTSLEKLRSEVDVRKQKELHSVCGSFLEKLTAVPAAEDEKSIGDQYWFPFRLACQPAMPPKLREAALDLLQKLLAHGYLRGALFIDYQPGDDLDVASVLNPSSNPTTRAAVSAASSTALENNNSSESPTAPASGDRLSASYPPLLIDDIVHTICMASPLVSFNENQANTPEAAVHLQIIKVLLTAVTSASCEVHEASLLKCLQACVNIYLYSKNLVNQTTAKAGLMQMLHFVFSQMESKLAPPTVSTEVMTSAKPVCRTFPVLTLTLSRFRSQGR